MTAVLIFLAIVALSQDTLASVLSTDAKSQAILNGETAEDGAIPWQVSLQGIQTRSSFCGGTIINKDYVLTVAHCMKNKTTRSIQVMAGSTDLRHPKSIHSVTKILVHPRYNPRAFHVYNDIALLKVDPPFVVSKTVNFVTLPEPGLIVPNGTYAIVSGWGDLWYKGWPPLQLQRTEIQIVDQDLCWRLYDRIYHAIDKTQICAWEPEFSSGSCHGDSGGPLTVEGKLVGLVAWSKHCNNTEFPSVFTRVSEYIDWINTNIVEDPSNIFFKDD